MFILMMYRHISYIYCKHRTILLVRIYIGEKMCGGGKEELLKVIKNTSNKNNYNFPAFTVSQASALSLLMALYNASTLISLNPHNNHKEE